MFVPVQCSFIYKHNTGDPVPTNVQTAE